MAPWVSPAHPRLRLAYPLRRLKQQELRSQDGNGKILMRTLPCGITCYSLSKRSFIVILISRVDYYFEARTKKGKKTEGVWVVLRSRGYYLHF
jgi:hypothetical protein